MPTRISVGLLRRTWSVVSEEENLALILEGDQWQRLVVHLCLPAQCCLGKLARY